MCVAGSLPLARPSVSDYIPRMIILRRALVASLGIFAVTGGGACSKPAAPAASSAADPVKEKVAGSPTPLAVGQKAHCPVTGEEFVVAASTVQVEHEGKHFAFCCADCAPSFKKDPSKYAKAN